MRNLRLETTAPFQGLPELVADREGLFAEQGISIEWIERDGGDPKAVNVGVNVPKGLNPFHSHGKMLERGLADMYNACELGNYCRVQDSRTGSRQLGRRAIMVFGAIVVRGDSPVVIPQQLAGRTVGVPFYFGSHYMALQLLEGFVPRELIKLCDAPNGSKARYDALMAGEVEATTLTEPYVTLAEKNGCKVICSAFYPGTEVASSALDAETYASFNAAVRESVRRINENPAAYMHYFIEYHAAKDPRIGALKPEELRPSRLLVTDPAPIPQDELARSAAWLKSWGMLEEVESPLELVNLEIAAAAHAAE